MRNMLAFLATLVLCFVGFGWYLGWYKIRSSPAPTGQRSLTVDINAAKIGDDLHKAEQKLQKKLEDGNDTNQTPTPAAKEQPKVKTPAETPTFTDEVDPNYSPNPQK
jgi:hypothetical protein